MRGDFHDVGRLYKAFDYSVLTYATRYFHAHSVLLYWIINSEIITELYTTPLSQSIYQVPESMSILNLQILFTEKSNQA